MTGECEPLGGMARVEATQHAIVISGLNGGVGELSRAALQIRSSS